MMGLMENGEFLFWNHRILPLRRHLTEDLSSGFYGRTSWKLLLWRSQLASDRTLNMPFLQHSSFATFSSGFLCTILDCFPFLSFLPRSCCVCLYIFPLPGLSSLVVFFSLLSLFGGPQGSHDFNYHPHVNGPQVSLWFTLISSSLLGISTWMTHMFS